MPHLSKFAVPVLVRKFVSALLNEVAQGHHARQYVACDNRVGTNKTPQWLIAWRIWLSARAVIEILAGSKKNVLLTAKNLFCSNLVRS
ncbi:hypothetical protein D3C78_1705010 [compost metagenome]